MLMWRTITLLWPFLKELFLGKKTLREALKTNKGRVFVILAIIGSVVMNVWLVPNIIRISADYVDLKHRYETLKKTGTVPTKPEAPKPDSSLATNKGPASDAQVNTQVASTVSVDVKSPDSTAADQQQAGYDRTLALFNRIHEREQQRR